MRLLTKTTLFHVYFLLYVIVASGQDRLFPRGTHSVSIPANKHINAIPLFQIANVIDQSIASGCYPGAVVLASHQGRIIYKGIFGSRQIVPSVDFMRFDTLFDLASLTKVVVTTTAIMQLLEQGKLMLDGLVSDYWSEFTGHDKEKITIRELLTHTSGLPPDIPSPEFLQTHGLPATGFPGQSETLNVNKPWAGQEEALYWVKVIKPLRKPGACFVYSDVNFLILGYLVERISGKRLDDYAQEYIFKPLGMQDTRFKPLSRNNNKYLCRERIAPTQVINGCLRWGIVHDPTTAAMGGVSGLAGVFSTAHDLGIFLDCLLVGGRIPKKNFLQREARYILSPLTIKKMTTAQSPISSSEVRGLGWDIDSYLASGRGVLFSANSFGHTGWTGTSMWVDPDTKTWIIILTSRTHPMPAPDSQLHMNQDRQAIANIIAASIKDVPDVRNTGRGEIIRAYTYSNR